MSDRPQLSLGQPPETLHKKLSTVPRGWLMLIVLLNLAVLACLAVMLRASSSGALASAAASPGSAKELKAVAAELEDKSLDAEAARAWEAYLAADPQCADRAEILYRVGRLSMQAEQFGPAAGAFVRSEHAASEDHDLRLKIAPQMVECLNRLGHYGEVQRELSRRVEVGGKEKAAETGSQKVLATITGRALTEADLDRMIERRVDQMLAMQGGGDPQQRKAVLQQMSAPAVRRQLLQELLKSELFCRRAREMGLDREDDFRQARDQLVENLLADRFLMRELDRIRPTAVDLESYFQAHQSQYETPESLSVVTIRLEEREEPAAVLSQVKSADDFRKLAAKRQPKGREQQAQNQQAQGRQILRGQQDLELGDVEPLFKLAEGQWTKQAQIRDKDRFLVLVEKKTPRQAPRLQDVLRQVQRDYVSRKQQEVAEKLMADLTQRYDVRILPETPTNAAGAEKSEKSEEKSKQGEAKSAPTSAAKP
jgi:hypothetical protein